MSETGESPKNFFSRFRRKDNSPSPEKLKAEAEAKAREAVTLFINSETQEAKVEYHPNGQNTFNIDKQDPTKGTIIRIRNDYKYAMADNVYAFFAIAKGGGNYHVWNVSSDEHQNIDPVFKVDKFNLIEIENVRQHEFLVEDALLALIGMPDEIATTKQIDVMWGGLAEKKKEPILREGAEPSPVSDLIPQPSKG